MLKIKGFLFILFTFLLGMSLTSKASISPLKEEENFQKLKEFNTNEAQLYYESEIYDINSKIDLTIFLDLQEAILDYNVQCISFEVVDKIIILKDKITFSIQYNNKEEKPYLEFTLNLVNGIDLSLSLYGFLKEEKLFISRSSFYAAEAVYLYYLQQNEIQKYESIRSEEMVCHDPEKPSNLMKYPSTSLLGDNPDTYVQGTFHWVDDYNISHPLQFNRVELWDKEPIGETLLDVTYTDENGFYRFEFENADNYIDFENGGYDVFIRLLPMGESTRVYQGNGSSYQEDLGYYENIPTGTMYEFSKTYYMAKDIKKMPEEFWEKYDFEFSQSLQISQAAIFASKYVREMNGKNITSASIRYPHNEPSTSCFYNRSDRTIYIINSNENQNIKSYASWDTIMHEYGHHVQQEFEICNNPGGAHMLEKRMGDHYKKHFTTGAFAVSCKCAWQDFSENECKLQGNQLAWGEGWATYFSIVAQQYFSNNLYNIKTVGDLIYTNYDKLEYDLIKNYRIGDDCEATVLSILYEMYDNSYDDVDEDSLGLGHKVMWNMTTGSKAKTFQEFDTYLRANYNDKSRLKYYGRILGYYNLAPSIVTSSSISTVSPTFSWTWNPSTPSSFFNETSYELNFYDCNYNLIGKTDRTASTSISPSEDLWISVINSGYLFYVSVTRYENNSPISCYEGEWRSYPKPYAEQMSLSTKYIRELAAGECYWFVFTAPQTATFIFETTGSTDTYGELFSQMVFGRTTDCRITYDDDSGDGSNFKISYLMNKGDVAFLRVRGYNWDRTGEFMISMSSLDHVHQYTHSYSILNDRYHIARCSCGKTIEEAHYYQSERLGQRCKYCKHYTEGPVITPGDLLKNKKAYSQRDKAFIIEVEVIPDSNVYSKFSNVKGRTSVICS